MIRIQIDGQALSTVIGQIVKQAPFAPDTANPYKQITVGTSGTLLLDNSAGAADPQQSWMILIRNNSSAGQIVWIGYNAATFTNTNDGYPLYPGESMELISINAQIAAIASAAGADVRILPLKAL